MGQTLPVTEYKHHLDGRTETFQCSAKLLTPDRAILSHVWNRTRPYQDGPAYLPAGAIHTDAFYWSHRTYLVYRLSDGQGQIYGHRIDVCENVAITPGAVHWTDLILDFWIDPHNQIHVLDRNEFEDSRAKGIVIPAHVETVERTARFLLDNYRAVMEDLKR